MPSPRWTEISCLFAAAQDGTSRCWTTQPGFRGSDTKESSTRWPLAVTGGRSVCRASRGDFSGRCLPRPAGTRVESEGAFEAHEHEIGKEDVEELVALEDT